MDHEAVARSIQKTGKLVVVEEDVKTAGWGAEVVARIVEGESFYALDRAPARVAGADVPIPYNKNLEAYVRPSPEKVVEAVRSLLDARVGVYSEVYSRWLPSSRSLRWAWTWRRPRSSAGWWRRAQR